MGSTGRAYKNHHTTYTVDYTGRVSFFVAAFFRFAACVCECEVLCIDCVCLSG